MGSAGDLLAGFPRTRSDLQGFARIRWDLLGSPLKLNFHQKDLRFFTEDAALPPGCEFAWDLMGSTADSMGIQCHYAGFRFHFISIFVEFWLHFRSWEGSPIDFNVYTH